MLIKTSHRDVPTSANGKRGTIRIYIVEPSIPGHPKAKFPGCVVFSEIYQVTGPVSRFASNIASAGYVVALPSSFHEFTGPEAIGYDAQGTDAGNGWKAEKTLEGYDEDATLSIDLLTSLPSCNGRIASTGMCLGGHLALRAAFDPRVLSTFCYFATDVHTSTLGSRPDDTLSRITAGHLSHSRPTLITGSQGSGGTKAGRTEVAMVFGKQDTHVDRAGRTKIREVMDEAGVVFSFYEVQAQHAFIRDESSKGRWDAALSRGLFGMMMELFERTVGRDLGPPEGDVAEAEHVC